MRLTMAELASVYVEARDWAKGLKVGSAFRGVDGETDYRYDENCPEHRIFSAVALHYLPDFMLIDAKGRIVHM